MTNEFKKEGKFRRLDYDEFYSFKKKVISELNGNNITEENILSTIIEINNIKEDNSSSDIKNENSDKENIEDIENYDEENINENTSLENDNKLFKNEGNIEQDKNSISINSI